MKRLLGFERDGCSRVQNSLHMNFKTGSVFSVAATKQPKHVPQCILSLKVLNATQLCCLCNAYLRHYLLFLPDERAKSQLRDLYTVVIWPLSACLIADFRAHIHLKLFLLWEGYTLLTFEKTSGLTAHSRTKRRVNCYFFTGFSLVSI